MSEETKSTVLGACTSDTICFQFVPAKRSQFELVMHGRVQKHQLSPTGIRNVDECLRHIHGCADGKKTNVQQIWEGETQHVSATEQRSAETSKKLGENFPNEPKISSQNVSLTGRRSRTVSPTTATHGLGEVPSAELPPGK